MALPLKVLHSPLPELLEDHAVGEALAADPDAFKNPVATQLIQHQMGVQLAGLGKKSMHVLFLYAQGLMERGRAPLDETGQTPPREGAVTARPPIVVTAQLHDPGLRGRNAGSMGRLYPKSAQTTRRVIEPMVLCATGEGFLLRETDKGWAARCTLPSSRTFFSWLGMMQRTKLGLVFLSVAMSLASCSLYSCPTVRNMPLRVLKAPGIAVSDMPATWSRPMMRSTGESRQEHVSTQQSRPGQRGRTDRQANLIRKRGDYRMADRFYLELTKQAKVISKG